MARYTRALVWATVAAMVLLAMLAGCSRGLRAGRGKPFADSTAGTVLIYGSVAQPVEVDLEMLRGIGPVRLVAEHPTEGRREYEGVRFADLFAQVEITNMCTCSTAAFQAADGRWAEIRLLDFERVPDGMLVPNGDAYDLVMPGLKAQYWLKDVRRIEIR